MKIGALTVISEGSERRFRGRTGGGRGGRWRRGEEETEVARRGQAVRGDARGKRAAKRGRSGRGRLGMGVEDLTAEILGEQTWYGSEKRQAVVRAFGNRGRVIGGTAVTMKKMLEASFPGIDVILSNYPPSLPKRLLNKIVPVAQFGVIGIIMGGEHIFPRLGMPPPQWYHSLRANRFGSMATTWLLGNFAQSFLQSSGAFEVYCNRELVFSKLKEHRFPSEFELRQLIASKIPDPAFGRNLDSIWS
ncbi:uncharacterized protein A4U43_C02F2630 [Asparagus officinalis]|uniref:Uncharacterized protein n=1 Tax=Asparagus officinalis TaxID=4686 RepID=A0A5P1FFA3_ASPOF|nr:uncharacterized protein A4U43_C02F2630 [Asparagus officinalis]